MTDMTASGSAPRASTPAPAASGSEPRVWRDIGIKRRYAAERRFKAYGLIAVLLGLVFLAMLLFLVVSKGYTAFRQTEIQLDITFAKSVIDPNGKAASNSRSLLMVNYPVLARDALAKKLGVDESDRSVLCNLSGMISNSVRTQLRDMVMGDLSIIGKTQTIWVLATADVDSAFKGQIDLSVDQSRRKVNDR